MSQLSAIQNQPAADPAAAPFGLVQDGQHSDKGIEYLVAANLARLRATRHLSLDALARLSGVSRAMLAQIEAGRSVPSIRSVHRIASALQVSVAAFLRDFASDGMQLLPAAAAPRLVSANARRQPGAPDMFPKRGMAWWFLLSVGIVLQRHVPDCSGACRFDAGAVCLSSLDRQCWRLGVMA